MCLYYKVKTPKKPVICHMTFLTKCLYISKEYQHKLQPLSLVIAEIIRNLPRFGEHGSLTPPHRYYRGQTPEESLTTFL